MRVADVVKTVAKIVANPGTATPQEVARRLAVCATCSYKAARSEDNGHTYDVCSYCNCPLIKKSAMAANTCPTSKW